MSGKNKILESYVHKIVEASFLKMNDKAKGLKVPGPKNSITTEPLTQPSTMDLVSLMNKVEELQAAENLSSEDKFHLARARQILSKVVSGKAVKESVTPLSSLPPRSERDELIDYISDTYKELRGFRPRPIWSELSDEDLKGWKQRLDDEVQEMVHDAQGDPTRELDMSRDDLNHQGQEVMPSKVPEKEDPYSDLENLASKLGISKSAKINR
jgi:hypothetical protein